MNKRSLILPVAAAMLFTSCGSTSAVGNDSATVSASTENTDSAARAVSGDLSDRNVDIDLTVLGSNMVYSQVYDMVTNSDDYVGKVVKATGSFAYYKDENTGNEYFAVLISDATACCSQGIEFVLDGDYTYPDDYPELGTELTVVGEFNYYKEDYSTYCQLLHAEMTDKKQLSWD